MKFIVVGTNHKRWHIVDSSDADLPWVIATCDDFGTADRFCSVLNKTLGEFETWEDYEP